MSDPIAAVATPASPSAIGILRLSGDGVISMVERVFRPLSGSPIGERPDRRLVYGALLDKYGQPIDQVLATVSRAPHSYTGEDTAELQCHGSPAVLAQALEALFAQGARQALPGEFTKRAFLNGRMDLAQAEAVIDLIDAETAEGARNAYGQLSGALSRRVAAVYDALVDVMAHFHAVLDYPDEDIDPFTADGLRAALETQRAALRALLDTYDRGSALTEGIPCAIVGQPNVGKSSLLNALLGYERAIVTDVAGTTRDTLEERIRLGGVLLRLCDTAGLRETGDAVERLGVERARQSMERARLILVLLDASQPACEEDFALLRQAMALAPTILVRSKSDLPSAPVPCVTMELPPAVAVSAKTGDGLEQLEAQIAALFPQGSDEVGSLLTNARQAEATKRALERIEAAQAGLTDGCTPDAVLTDVEEALSALGELTGRTVCADITDRIFSRFCVGK